MLHVWTIGVFQACPRTLSGQVNEHMRGRISPDHALTPARKQLREQDELPFGLNKCPGHHFCPGNQNMPADRWLLLAPLNKHVNHTSTSVINRAAMPPLVWCRPNYSRRAQCADQKETRLMSHLTCMSLALWPISSCVVSVSFTSEHSSDANAPLLGKCLLMVHRFCLLMAHYQCAISTTPLVFFTNGASLMRH